MTLDLDFVPSKESFRACFNEKFRCERCSSDRWGSAQNGFRLFLSGQVAPVFRRAINFCVHETKLTRYHLNS